MGPAIRQRQNILPSIEKGVKKLLCPTLKTGLGFLVELCKLNSMDFSKLSSLTRQSGPAPKFAPETQVSGIVTVKKKGYFPKNLNLKVRSWISDQIFTADFLAGEISAIKNDPQIVDVTVSEAIPLQKLPVR
jgi:hypothetical protein